jgi:hypothetical protein
MKNIHVLPTDKPSRLLVRNDKPFVLMLKEHSPFATTDTHQNQNIYITSDEEIKAGDWTYNIVSKTIFTAKQELINLINHPNLTLTTNKKIILTTDLQLIADGIQAIDDEFLEWFVKNPSCEFVRVNNLCYGALSGFADAGYKIIIPKEKPNPFELPKALPDDVFYQSLEEPKQETLEEAAENYASKKLQRPLTIYYPLESNVAEYVGFIEGAKWQQEQDKKMYSDEEVLEIINRLGYDLGEPKSAIEEWFEQFKRNNMKQETAVEWLTEKLKSQGLLIGEPNNLVAVREAKEMFEQQIIDAIIFYKERPHLEINAEQYYNEKFRVTIIK